MGVIAISSSSASPTSPSTMDARPSESVSLVSEIARATLPGGSTLASPMYYAVQALTFGDPRPGREHVVPGLSAAGRRARARPLLPAPVREPRRPARLLERNPRPRRDRRRCSIWVFHADVISLIHLYVIGVFTAFTLSQAGMVRHWARRKEPGWRRKAVVNGVGAVATGLVTVLVIQAKFSTAPGWSSSRSRCSIAFFFVVNRHYRDRRAAPAGGQRGGHAAARAEQHGRPLRREARPRDEARGLVRGADRGRRLPRRSASPDGTRRPDPRRRWWEFTGGGPQLEALERRDAPRRRGARLRLVASRGESSFLTVVVPELFERPSLVSAVVRRRTTFSLKLRLLSEPGIVVTERPARLDGDDGARTRDAPWSRVLVSGVQAASLRAVNYARTSARRHPRASSSPSTRDEAERDCARLGAARSLGVPARDRRGALPRPRRPAPDATCARSRRTRTSSPRSSCPSSSSRTGSALLHNQRALYIKRLLLFEPRVILSSVPYHLP